MSHGVGPTIFYSINNIMNLTLFLCFQTNGFPGVGKSFPGVLEIKKRAQADCAKSSAKLLNYPNQRFLQL